MHERIIKNKRKAGKKTKYNRVKRQSKHVYNCECVRICVCVCVCAWLRSRRTARNADTGHVQSTTYCREASQLFIFIHP